MPDHGRSAAEVGIGPDCECHGIPMRWNRRADLTAGGYWRCNEKYRPTAKRWRDANRDKRLAAMRAWQAANPERRRAYQRAWRYGMTPQEYSVLIEEHAGFCGICGQAAEKSAKGVLHVDHDHATGAVRGLLCNRCNTALERVEIPGWVERARAYLER